jgi:hypothetical protein
MRDARWASCSRSPTVGEIAASLVVAADGSASALRAQEGIGVSAQWDYGQTGDRLRRCATRSRIAASRMSASCPPGRSRCCR